MLAVEAVPNESITLRSAAIAQSLGTDHGFLSALVLKNVTQSNVIIYLKHAILDNILGRSAFKIIITRKTRFLFAAAFEL